DGGPRRRRAAVEDGQAGRRPPKITCHGDDVTGARARSENRRGCRLAEERDVHDPPRWRRGRVSSDDGDVVLVTEGANAFVERFDFLHRGGGRTGQGAQRPARPPTPPRAVP